MRSPSIEVRPGDLACGVDARCEDFTRWGKGGEGAPAIANEAVIRPSKDGVKPGDLARRVDAPWLGAGRMRYRYRRGYVKAAEGAPAIANEAMRTRRIVVPPGDLARGVDALWEGGDRTRWVEAGDGLSVDRRDRWGQHAHKEHHRRKPFSISHQTNSFLRLPAFAGCVVGRILLKLVGQ